MKPKVSLYIAIVLTFTALVFCFSQCSKPPAKETAQIKPFSAVRPTPSVTPALVETKAVTKPQRISRAITRKEVATPTPECPPLATAAVSKTTGEMVRARNALGRRAPVFYASEVVENFQVPPGLLAIVNPLPYPPFSELCTARYDAPCIIITPGSGNYLTLGRCFGLKDGRLKRQDDCSEQMAHDLTK